MQYGSTFAPDSAPWTLFAQAATTVSCTLARKQLLVPGPSLSSRAGALPAPRLPGAAQQHRCPLVVIREVP